LTRFPRGVDPPFSGDLSVDETAEVIGVPAGTVKSRLFHAKKNDVKTVLSREHENMKEAQQKVQGTPSGLQKASPSEKNHAKR
jgi:hypothetical protein